MKSGANEPDFDLDLDMELEEETGKVQFPHNCNTDAERIAYLERRQAYLRDCIELAQTNDAPAGDLAKALLRTNATLNAARSVRQQQN